MIGGKAAHLRTLADAGFAVPPWSVIGLDVLRDFRLRSGLDAEIAALLSGLNPDTAYDIAERIAKAFAVTPLDGPALSAIWRAYDAIGQGRVAVRSSGADEDLPNVSFAGQYSSFLGLSGFDAVAEHVRECWASGYSARSLVYRWLHGLPTDRIDLAVIVQRIVPAEVSGVMFTAHPVTGNRAQSLISCVYGLGETLASGAVDPDTLTLDRESGVVGDAVIGEKAERLDAGPDGPVLSRVSGHHRERFALTNDQVGELGELGAEIERLFGCPQDVEWAFADGAFHVLQARPITTLREAEGELRVWDSAHIDEAFGEVTAPLTFSFARSAYQKVYRDHVRALGVPESDIAKMDEWFGDMLGYFDGRVYYNVLNWYKVIRLLPGYKLHRRVLERALGVRETSDELADAQHPIDSAGRQRLVRLRVAVRFVRMFFGARRSVSSFVDDFAEAAAEFEGVDYSSMPGQEVNRALYRLEERLLTRWGPTAVLDNVLMLSFGVLHGLNQRWLRDAPAWLAWEAVRPSNEPGPAVRRMGEIAAELATRDRLAVEVAARDVSALPEWLAEARGDDAVWLRDALTCYLAEHGHLGGLKLEEPDLRDDPVRLMGLLQEALQNVRSGTEAEEAAAAARRRAEAEAYLEARLSAPKRFVYNLVRTKVREALHERERVRHARVHAFGLARRMFQAIGRDLEAVGALGDRREVFFLKVEEIRAAYAGTLNHREMRPLADLRRDQQTRQRLMPAPPPRFTTRGSVYWSLRSPDPGDDPADVLRGIPCSPGIATGPARLLDEPADAEGGIIVTRRTDPRWVSVLSTASGLLIERGGPLSHVAIVARELHIPAIARIPTLTTRIPPNTPLTLNGTTGTVHLPTPTPHP
ncbi:PEP/pyruvate-binding domain-containing protein [Actinocorallia sp. A-T 12471]|uniref:PEP/pyruvate-binding domain-containing protein n=1 Tax=Actinocorallia sp. A-T 12471 TaxID=3089813 RepID=UPI0029CE1A05|nr:PEP/pyruvate-binding domain-containing protein [Actinocorallia sp. A-T 12471]MDX6739311.1 PEP/pyruvate-binding domain-containing protein [Actinocorallia sp. A-T 12471]